MLHESFASIAVFVFLALAFLQGEILIFTVSGGFCDIPYTPSSSSLDLN